MKILIATLILLTSGAAFAADDAKYTCEDAADRVSSIIDDWYLFVKSSGAEDKNPSVVAMHADQEKGALVENFKTQCLSNWDRNADIFACLSGIRSELGAAMCSHPDTNKNGWRYL